MTMFIKFEKTTLLMGTLNTILILIGLVLKRKTSALIVQSVF